MAASGGRIKYEFQARGYYIGAIFLVSRIGYRCESYTISNSAIYGLLANNVEAGEVWKGPFKDETGDGYEWNTTDRQNSLALALRELGRIERTLFTLEWLQNPELRRRVNAVQLQRLGWDFRSLFWVIIDSPRYLFDGLLAYASIIENASICKYLADPV